VASDFLQAGATLRSGSLSYRIVTTPSGVRAARITLDLEGLPDDKWYQQHWLTYAVWSARSVYVATFHTGSSYAAVADALADVTVDTIRIAHAAPESTGD
jgi:hypothetical protein